jgi:ketosteroid isomerase-like protein
MASSTTMVRPGEIVQAAISRGDLARVRDLLRNGASATERGRHDTTALHWAAAANEAAIVRELLDHGADPNARAADGCSALHYAAREDAAEAVNALLAGGADARATNREGRTPLQEVYDEEDEDGAATARALRDGEKSKALFSFDANATETKDSRSVGACTKDSDAAETKKRATSFGPTNSAADDALERAMEDMARLLRAEKGASPAGPNAETSASTAQSPASKKTTRSSSGSGATDSGARENGGSFKTLTARKYVPAASHTLPGCVPKTKASVRVRLGPDGRLSLAEYEKLKHAYLATAPGFPGNEKESGVSYERVPEVAVAKADARRGTVRLGDAS